MMGHAPIWGPARGERPRRSMSHYIWCVRRAWGGEGVRGGEGGEDARVEGMVVREI